ncbi:mariner Mos1 transposase [Trichonephila clavipes]|uniref:Mariner Mos1 transposase n=1 Tax=Trichonephila clavipes TaxID=2585209 RepID=A0A8X6SXA5_TRICX|nr:mariner Mos1 transposase [Trichonephila clavipes]
MQILSSTFKNNDFELEDKELFDALKKFEIIKSSSTIFEISESVRNDPEKGQGLLYGLKPRGVELQKKECFSCHIVTGDEKWIQCDNPKSRRSWCKPGHASTSSSKPDIYGLKLLIWN